MGVQAEVRAVVVWQEGKWGAGAGLSHSTVGHRFPQGAIRLSGAHSTFPKKMPNFGLS